MEKRATQFDFGKAVDPAGDHLVGIPSAGCGSASIDSAIAAFPYGDRRWPLHISF